MFLHRTAPRSEATARTGLTRQVSIYSHKVWWRRAQDAKEITHAIQQQVKTLKDECVAVVEKDHDEIEAQSKASACSQSHDDLSVKIKNLDLLLRHVPLTSADQSFVMARLKSTCIDLRQLEMRAAICSRPDRKHSGHWQVVVETAQHLRVSLYSVIAQPARLH